MSLKNMLLINNISKNTIGAIQNKSADKSMFVKSRNESKKQEDKIEIASKIVNYKPYLVYEAFDRVRSNFNQIEINKNDKVEFLYALDEFLSLVAYAVFSNLENPNNYFESYLENLKNKYIDCDSKRNMYIMAINYMKEDLIVKMSSFSEETTIESVYKYFDFISKGI